MSTTSALDQDHICWVVGDRTYGAWPARIIERVNDSTVRLESFGDFVEAKKKTNNLQIFRDKNAYSVNVEKGLNHQNETIKALFKQALEEAHQHEKEHNLSTIPTDGCNTPTDGCSVTPRKRAAPLSRQILSPTKLHHGEKSVPSTASGGVEDSGDESELETFMKANSISTSTERQLYTKNAVVWVQYSDTHQKKQRKYPWWPAKVEKDYGKKIKVLFLSWPQSFSYKADPECVKTATANKAENRRIYDEGVAYLHQEQFDPVICEHYLPALKELEAAVSARLRSISMPQTQPTLIQPYTYSEETVTRQTKTQSVSYVAFADVPRDIQKNGWATTQTYTQSTITSSQKSRDSATHATDADTSPGQSDSEDAACDVHYDDEDDEIDYPEFTTDIEHTKEEVIKKVDKVVNEWKKGTRQLADQKTRKQNGERGWGPLGSCSEELLEWMRQRYAEKRRGSDDLFGGQAATDAYELTEMITNVAIPEFVVQVIMKKRGVKRATAEKMYRTRSWETTHTHSKSHQ